MILYLTIVALIFSVVEADNVKAHFPKPTNNVTFPRLRFESTLPNLTELTACFWVKISSLILSRYGTILSYATNRNDNEFQIALFNQSGKAMLGVYRENVEANMDCGTNCQVGTWCHICVSWFGSDGRVSAFVNGDSCKGNFLNYKEPYVPTGGVLVVGQEQDDLDSKYDATEAWIGDIADIQLWDEVLSEQQIIESGSCRDKRRQGNIISWLNSPMAAVDGVVLSGTQLCVP